MSNITRLTPRRRKRRKGKYVRRLERRVKRLLVIVLLGVIGSLWAMYGPEESGSVTEANLRANADIFSGVVSKVVDGDTFAITGQRERVRVWGLDAPELGTQAGEDAAITMRGLIQEQALNCQIKDKDRYGRIVAKCSLLDGRDIAKQMIETGAAREYCYFSKNAYGTC